MEEKKEKPLRLKCVEICIDVDGNFTVDGPRLDQEGNVGWATTVMDGSLEAAVEMAKIILTHFRPFLAQRVKDLQPKPASAIVVPGGDAIVIPAGSGIVVPGGV